MIVKGVTDENVPVLGICNFQFQIDLGPRIDILLEIELNQSINYCIDPRNNFYKMNGSCLYYFKIKTKEIKKQQMTRTAYELVLMEVNLVNLEERSLKTLKWKSFDQY